jgi:hypothetical protein
MQEFPTILMCVPTRDRARCLERVLRFYLDQDYEGTHILWVYNNSPHIISIDIGETLPSNKHIILQNSAIHSTSHLPYTNMGVLFEDIKDQLPLLCREHFLNPSILTWSDDDDIYLPSHLSSGVEGMKQAWDKGCKAYKPMYSYFRNHLSVERTANTFEPSIFVDFNYMNKSHFRQTSIDYHQGWLDPLLDLNLVHTPINGNSTLIYDWSGEIPVYKISGSGDNSQANYDKYKANSKDVKDIIYPISKYKAQTYYSLINGL